MSLGKGGEITLTQVFEAQFSDDPTIKATAPDLARLYFLQQDVLTASFAETAARAKLSTAQLEIGLNRSHEELSQALAALQALVSELPEDTAKQGE
jgi:hypothetical protein